MSLWMPQSVPALAEMHKTYPMPLAGRFRYSILEGWQFASLLAFLFGVVLTYFAITSGAFHFVDTAAYVNGGRFGPSDRIYSFVKDRPLEVCSTYLEDRAQVYPTAQQFRNGSLAGEVAALSAYDHAAKELLDRKCRGDWTWQSGNDSYLYAQIARDLPFAWLAAKYNKPKRSLPDCYVYLS
jgi:hypothetical protein